MTKQELAIIKFCAEEVERQQDSPTAVYWMVEAWRFALGLVSRVDGGQITNGVIWELGRIVKNCSRHGYRRCEVRVGATLCPAANEVPRLMSRYVELLDAMTPAEAYKEFEEIHPFTDGNGRVGKIIYNWMLGALEEPQMPPNFFNCSNS